jgi:hypothetical protein
LLPKVIPLPRFRSTTFGRSLGCRATVSSILNCINSEWSGALRVHCNGAVRRTSSRAECAGIRVGVTRIPHLRGIQHCPGSKHAANRREMGQRAVLNSRVTRQSVLFMVSPISCTVKGGGAMIGSNSNIGFVRRHKMDGTHDSIGPTCLATVATTQNELDLRPFGLVSERKPAISYGLIGRARARFRRW